MKNPYPLPAYLPEPLAQYGLHAPGAPATPRPADYDRARADTRVAGLGLLTALLVDDPELYRTHVDMMELDVRDQLIALAEVAPHVCRHREVIEFLEHVDPPMQQAAMLILVAITAAQSPGQSPALTEQQLAAGRAIGSLLDQQTDENLLAALQEIAVATCSPEQLEAFGDAVAGDDTPLS